MYQFHYDSSCKSKYYDDSNKLIVGKMKDERSNIAFKYLIELNLKMHLFQVDHKNEHKIAKGINKNVVENITESKYKNVLFNKKCLRHLINRSQWKNHRKETHGIKKNLFVLL